MSFLPVAARELRVGARQNRLYWGRFAVAMIALAISAWVWNYSHQYSPSAKMAESIFSAVSFFAMAYACLVGLGGTADSISEEKRDGTMGLLFLTNLRGYDVVTGKLFASSLSSFYGLLSILPILAIPLLLGGLTQAEFWRMALVLVNAMMLSLSVGLFISSISRESRAAQGGALGLFLLIGAGWPGAVAWYSESVGPLPEIYCAPSPLYTYTNVRESEYLGNAYAFWFSLAFVQAEAWLLFILASSLVRHTWQDRARETKAGWQARWNRWRLGSDAVRRTRRRRLLDINPYYWISSRDRLAPLYVLAPPVVGVLVWIAYAWKEGQNIFDRDIFFFLALLSGLFLKFYVVSESGRLLAEQRRSGGLELTLSTPLRVREIIEGQCLGLLRQFGPAVVTVAVADWAMFFLSWSYGRSGPDEFLGIAIAYFIVFLADLITIPVVGMWNGLSMRRSGRAAVFTGAVVLVLPWLILMVLVMIIRAPGSHAAEIMYAVVCLSVDFLAFSVARYNLTERFRETVTEGTRPG
jgi:ABC-type transport system involved in cytochrome c biogenesis permease component